MKDVELDERLTALEENGGGGSSQNGKGYFVLNKEILMVSSVFQPKTM